ncbi:MAG: universal stress protein [Bacteroidetes bacterium]|jgi:nucleotide-binding universal stress UspA family protein|nr:universal stress protein [Bacteroidota bacterium]
MLSIQRILVPTDLSGCADEALRHAAFLADWHDAELHLLNVAARHMHAYDAMKEGFPLNDAALASLLRPDNGAEQHLPALDDLTIEQHQIEHASPAVAIRDYADEHDFDLVVMGTHGRRGTNRLLMGSVAEDVVRTVHCPTLTVREEAAVPAGQAVRRILVPIDFSTSSRLALDHAKELAMTYGAEIHLLHVVEEIAMPAAYGMEPISFAVPDIIQSSEKALAEMAEQDIGYEHVQVKSVAGYPATSILDYIDENEVDLVTIATHGRTGLDRLLLGSVAEKVVRRAACPVFTVKTYGKALVASEYTQPSRSEA